MTTRSAESITPAVSLGFPSANAIPADVLDAIERLGVAQYLPQVIDLTREIYGGYSEVSLSADPEVGDSHVIFHAPVDCSIEEALAMDYEWGRRLDEIIPTNPRVYLASTYVQ